MTAAGGDPGVWRFDAVAIARRAWRRRAWLARVNGAALALATAVVLVVPRTYLSSVTLVPAPRDGLALDFTGAGLGFAAPIAGLGGQPTPQDQLRLVVTSRAVADTVIRSLGLVGRWKQKGMEGTRRKLAEATTVTTPREGQVIVEAAGRSAVEARDLAASYARAAALESVRIKSSLASQRRGYLEARLAALDRELASASAELRRFEERHRAVDLPDQARASMEAAGTLRAQLGLVETELAAVRRWFADGTPEVRSLADRAAELRRQLARIQRDGDPLLPGGGALPALKERYLGLAREQQSLIAVGELLRRAYEQARVEEANPVPAFSVLDAADLPERPARPPRALALALAALVSAAGSIAWMERRGDAGAARPDALADAERRAA